MLDLSLPGVEVRPITEMTGQSHFNEVFLTDVRVPVDCRIGEEGDGWRLAKVTLGNERVSLSEGGVCWGMGPTSNDAFDLLRAEGVAQAYEIVTFRSEDHREALAALGEDRPPEFLGR